MARKKDIFKDLLTRARTGDTTAEGILRKYLDALMETASFNVPVLNKDLEALLTATLEESPPQALVVDKKQARQYQKIFGAEPSAEYQSSDILMSTKRGEVINTYAKQMHYGIPVKGGKLELQFLLDIEQGLKENIPPFLEHPSLNTTVQALWYALLYRCRVCWLLPARSGAFTHADIFKLLEIEKPARWHYELIDDAWRTIRGMTAGFTNLKRGKYTIDFEYPLIGARARIKYGKKILWLYEIDRRAIGPHAVLWNVRQLEVEGKKLGDSGFHYLDLGSLSYKLPKRLRSYIQNFRVAWGFYHKRGAVKGDTFFVDWLRTPKDTLRRPRELRKLLVDILEHEKAAGYIGEKSGFKIPPQKLKGRKYPPLEVWEVKLFEGPRKKQLKQGTQARPPAPSVTLKPVDSALAFQLGEQLNKLEGKRHGTHPSIKELEKLTRRYSRSVLERAYGATHDAVMEARAGNRAPIKSAAAYFTATAKQIAAEDSGQAPKNR